MSVNSQRLRWVGLGILVVGAVLLALWGMRVFRTARSLLAHANEAQALLDRGLLDTDPAVLGELVYGVRADIVALRRDAGWAAALGPALRWVPKWGPILAQSPVLLDMADVLTELGVLLWDDAALGLTLLASDVAPLDTLVILQPDMAADLPEARVLVERAAAAYNKLDITALPGPLQRLNVLETVLPLAHDGLVWVEFIPLLLGMDAPRTYLVLALNEGELRPGGGFITGVGEVHVVSGKITGMTFVDSYAVDDFSQPYPLAPEPFRQFMNIDLWVFRDSNWSPDFPTSVLQALELYHPPEPVVVDGVVAVDQYAVQTLVDALGPLTLPGSDAPVTGEALLEYIYGVWSPEDGQFDQTWWNDRKSFMEPLAEAIVARIEHGDVDWGVLLKAGMALLQQKHIQVYLTDVEAEAQLAALGWAGGLRVPEGDYAMVVEANMGFNKASARLERVFTYDVDLTHSPPRATATLAYTHTSQVEIECKSEARYNLDYQQMADRCYWGYVRFYVPEGAQLIKASHHPIPAAAVANGIPWDGRVRTAAALEGAYTVFEQAILLPTASQTQVEFVYTLPENVLYASPDGTMTYRLTWQKQAGLRAVPARVILRLPRNAVLCSPQPRSVMDDNGVLLYDMLLDVDQQWNVCYRLVEEK